MADASKDMAQHSAHAMAADVTMRQTAWLRKWGVDVIPFKGGNLFGEALEPMLIETKGKKKVLPTTERPVKQSSKAGHRFF